MTESKFFNKPMLAALAHVLFPKVTNWSKNKCLFQLLDLKYSSFNLFLRLFGLLLRLAATLCWYRQPSHHFANSFFSQPRLFSFSTFLATFIHWNIFSTYFDIYFLLILIRLENWAGVCALVLLSNYSRSSPLHPIIQATEEIFTLELESCHFYGPDFTNKCGCHGKIYLTPIVTHIIWLLSLSNISFVEISLVSYFAFQRTFVVSIYPIVSKLEQMYLRTYHKMI